MSTKFTTLPIVDISLLNPKAKASDADLRDLSTRLYDIFATTGFAYLVNVPLSFKHADVFRMAGEFFALPEGVKMGVAKRAFREQPLQHEGNTYRGYFPTQPTLATDNLKEGFEMGPPAPVQPSNIKPTVLPGINLTEANIWPDADMYAHRENLEKLYTELQSLSSSLLSLLALALRKSAGYFEEYLTDSLSTLRLLHYPTVSHANGVSTSGKEEGDETKLSCTPHTDSGILTLLHQDPTGGLEVRNADGHWVSAPYIPESLVVNIGDLMAKVSGGRFVATMHRVRAPQKVAGEGVIGRLSVPFFFEPGERCRVRAVDGDEEVVVYGEHVREKMKGFVEFKDL